MDEANHNSIKLIILAKYTYKITFYTKGIGF